MSGVLGVDPLNTVCAGRRRFITEIQFITDGKRGERSVVCDCAGVALVQELLMHPLGPVVELSSLCLYFTKMKPLPMTVAFMSTAQYLPEFMARIGQSSVRIHGHVAVHSNEIRNKIPPVLSRSNYVRAAWATLLLYLEIERRRIRELRPQVVGDIRGCGEEDAVGPEGAEDAQPLQVGALVLPVLGQG